MENFLSQKLQLFQKMLGIAQEQQESLNNNNLDQFQSYLTEKSKMIAKIEELDKGFESGLAQWEMEKPRVSETLIKKVNKLNDQIQDTIRKIKELQETHMNYMVEGKGRLKEEVLKFRHDRKVVGRYEEPKSSAKILDIKR